MTDTVGEKPYGNGKSPHRQTTMTPFCSVLRRRDVPQPRLDSGHTRAVYIPTEKLQPDHLILRLLHSSSTTIIIMQRFVYLFVFALIGESVSRKRRILNNICSSVVMASVASAGTFYFSTCNDPCRTGGHVPTCCYSHGLKGGYCRGGRAICAF